MYMLDTPFYILQSVLGDISETTVLPHVHYHFTGLAVVKSVIVQIRYATIFMDAITKTVGENLLNKILVILIILEMTIYFFKKRYFEISKEIEY